MNNEKINQSELMMYKSYVRLINKVTEHSKILFANKLPTLRIMSIKRMLIRNKRMFGSFENPKTIETVEVFVKTNPNAQKLINDCLDVFNIDISEAFYFGLIKEFDLTKTIVAHKYYEMGKDGMKYQDVKFKLSREYNISVNTIDKLIYGNGKERTGRINPR